MARPGLTGLSFLSAKKLLDFASVLFIYLFVHQIASLAIRAVWPDPGLKGSKIA